MDEKSRMNPEDRSNLSDHHVKFCSILFSFMYQNKYKKQAQTYTYTQTYTYQSERARQGEE